MSARPVTICSTFKRDDQEGEDKAHQAAGHHRDEHAEPQRARVIGADIGGEGAHQHGALEAHIVDAAALGDHLANGRQQDGCGNAHGRRQDADDDRGFEKIGDHARIRLSLNEDAAQPAR